MYNLVQVGTPPIPVVERLHEAGIMVMNMVGSPRHVSKALDCGVDAVCAQGTEAGGHTGDVATIVLIPQVNCSAHPTPSLSSVEVGLTSVARGGSVWICAEVAPLRLQVGLFQ